MTRSTPALLLAALALAACKTNDEPTSSPSTSGATSAATIPAAASAAAPKPQGPLASTVHPDLLDPSKANAKAPDVFKAKFSSTKGDFVIEVHREWAPNGADRFYNLVKVGFFDDTRFFRAIDGFMVQFGISGDPAVAAKWSNQNIQDDTVKGSNKRTFVTFAQTGMPNSRSTQVFINYADNVSLDGQRFAPFGQVVSGMDVVDSLYKGYGEGAPGGRGPSQGLIQSQGNAYLDSKFPKLDGIKQATVLP
jgi:peptidyl-prolyl cis-trans isomerase A (cyclophilin A)